MPKKEFKESAELAKIIVEGILKKKGHEIISMNLTKLNNAVSNYFIICHGTSKVQTEAIAGSVMEEALKSKKAKPWHKEGFENAEWILLDYVDVVVHIFLEETRKFYNLESLWADAEIKEYNMD
ncbi:MAG: ribosome silencing factor [Bacteroidales bacterium]|nr:ribosome silencing factor [Bacteroidales bacterium]MCF8403633.1 ribosome silencing factor [Bacteroidales bacterium]